MMPTDKQREALELELIRTAPKGMSLTKLREVTGKDLFIDNNGELREPCFDGCPGYGAFDCERPARAGLIYDHDPALELEMCQECNRFASDELAYAQWVKDGKPVLGGFTVESEPPDDITIYTLLQDLAKKAKAKGWDLSKLQDEVYAHFETTDG